MTLLTSVFGGGCGCGEEEALNIALKVFIALHGACDSLALFVGAALHIS
jgi:hypothetical protein